LTWQVVCPRGFSHEGSPEELLKMLKRPQDKEGWILKCPEGRTIKGTREKLINFLESELGCEGMMSNPEIPEKCKFRKELKKPKEYFDPASFRTLCPECPQARCALCPPELECATRIIIGCKKGQFKAGVCQIGTETHVIYHGQPKPA